MIGWNPFSMAFALAFLSTESSQKKQKRFLVVVCSFLRFFHSTSLLLLQTFSLESHLMSLVLQCRVVIDNDSCGDATVIRVSERLFE